ncbi:phasin family protein [Aurantiacibacter zhengii]|uniref:Phasin family protein n=1 Tax=Aurantiacibacter zhengii TaxID=2307003 RepID=A0A418NQS5_9SPHN|nr:phasin family protein [Aurantiacibacter zhengii]RIV85066.1 phasin family protein [Aurantiacibacter zhengii]
MAESTSKTDDRADTATAAAEPAKSEVKAEETKVEEKTAPAADKAPAKKASSAKKAPAAAKKAAPKKAAAKKVAAKKAAPAKKPVAKKTPAPKASKASAPAAKSAKAEPSVNQLKEKIMATANFDYSKQITESMTEAVSEMQARTQAAYDKSTEAMGEMTDFAKGNVEAVVETGKVFAESMQGMGKTLADEAKTAYELATADIKDMASIKSPTELFQLQGKIMRRNFDAMVSMTSKTTDATMKMANDVAAPLSARVNVAAEKMTKVA